MSWAMNRYRLSRAVHGIEVNYDAGWAADGGANGSYIKAQGDGARLVRGHCGKAS